MLCFWQGDSPQPSSVNKMHPQRLSGDLKHCQPRILPPTARKNNLSSPSPSPPPQHPVSQCWVCWSRWRYAGGGCLNEACRAHQPSAHVPMLASFFKDDALWPLLSGCQKKKWNWLYGRLFTEWLSVKFGLTKKERLGEGKVSTECCSSLCSFRTLAG